MKRVVLFGAVIALLGSLAGPVSADQSPPRLDPVATWNQLAMETVRATRTSDADAARSYAMVNAAIYDAVNGIAARHDRRDRAFLLTPPAGAPASTTGSPRTSPGSAAARRSPPDAPGARPWAIMSWTSARRTCSRPVESQAGGTGSGVFPLSWSGVQCRDMVPFGIADAAPYVAAGPPPLDSLDYAAAFAEVKLLGNLNIADPAKLALYQYWSLPAGSAQPPGEMVPTPPGTPAGPASSAAVTSSSAIRPGSPWAGGWPPRSWPPSSSTRPVPAITDSARSDRRPVAGRRPPRRVVDLPGMSFLVSRPKDNDAPGFAHKRAPWSRCVPDSCHVVRFCRLARL